MKKIIFLFLILIQNCFSQGLQLTETAKISVLTCGRGYQELYMTYGHTAIRVQDVERQLDVVFNYGNFDFREGNFYLKFIKGDLEYFVAVIPFNDFVTEYQMQNREVIEQTLNLNPAQKQEVFNELNNSLLPENRFYTYKFIDRNCTTLAKEKIEKALRIKIEKIDDKSITYRELLYPYFDDFFYFKLGINIIFGAKTDEKATQLFLPVELQHSLDKYKLAEQPLVKKTETIVTQTPEPKKGFSFFNSIYFIITVLVIVLILNKKFINNSVLILFGLLGLFLCLVGLYSLHKEVLWNYNALLFNPLFLILPFLNGKNFRKMYYLVCLCLVVYIGIMLTKPHIYLMLPFIITAGILVVRSKKLHWN